MKLFPLVCATMLSFGSDRSIALESDDTPVADCQFKSMLTISGEVMTVSAGQFSQMCEDFVRSQRAMPPASVLKSIGKVATLIHARDAAQDEQKVAYQLIAIIEARGVTTPAQMNSTADIVFKAHSATGGLVSPKDLNIALRGMGRRASGISDDSLLTLAAIIWNKKKDMGE